MRISGNGHSVEVLKNGSYSIKHEKLGLSFSGARARFECIEHGDKTLAALDVDSMKASGDSGTVNFASRHGKAQLKVSLKPEGVYLRMSLVHPGSLSRIIPLAIEDENSSLDLTKNIHHVRFMRMGYQSWSPSGSWSVLEKEPFPLIKMIRQGAMNPRICVKPRAGLYHCDYATVLTDTKTGSSMLVGFITAKKYLPSLNLELGHDPRGATDRLNLTAYCDVEDTQGDGPTEEREAETLLIAFGDDPHELWERYLDVVAKENKARNKAPMPVGWCSWYHYFALVTERALRANLEELKRRKSELGVEVFQIDDGYCVPGDWLEWNDKFGSGPERLAKDIADAGFTPGVWLAPFICSRGSRLYKEHKDWLLKNDKGKPILVGLNPWWKGKSFHALDLTNPDALDYVERVMKQVKQWGFRYVKIDFVFAAALPGNRHDPKKTGLEAYRMGLATIRKALGNDVFLLGCGAPILPSVGYVDGMRVSADVAQYWRSKITRAVVGAPFDPAAENAVHGTICRSAMHKRLWLNDPDCLLVRKSKSLLSLDEVRTLATTIFMSGGMLLLSDDMTALDPDRWEIIRACFPPLGKAARPLDLFVNSNPSAYHLPLDKGQHLLALLNWRNRNHTPSIEPNCLGLKGPHHAFEFWSERYLGIVEDEPKHLAFSLEPHGCALIKLVPVTGEPVVVGTSLSLSMGEIEIEREKVSKNKLSLTLKLPGPRAGNIYAIKPEKGGAGELIKKRVEFKDKGEVEISF